VQFAVPVTVAWNDARATIKAEESVRNLLRLITGFVTAIGLLSATVARAADTADDRWQFELTPYLFASGLYGTTGAQGIDADVEMGFDDVLEQLEMGFMGTLEMRRGRWGILFDGLYFELGGERSSSWQGPLGIGSATGELEVSATMQMYQLSAGYRLGEGVTIDLIGAARYTQLDTDLELVVTTGGLLPGGTRSLSAKESWWDPVVGARALIPFGQHWSVVLYGDIGGFGVGSDLTYQAIAGVNWQFSKHFSAKAGYRYLYQDFEDDGFVWDMAAHGPYLGLGIRF
jgi:opacity protein-like surface antigen